MKQKKGALSPFFIFSVEFSAACGLVLTPPINGGDVPGEMPAARAEAVHFKLF